MICHETISDFFSLYWIWLYLCLNIYTHNLKNIYIFKYISLNNNYIYIATIFLWVRRSSKPRFPPISAVLAASNLFYCIYLLPLQCGGGGGHNRWWKNTLPVFCFTPWFKWHVVVFSVRPTLTPLIKPRDTTRFVPRYPHTPRGPSHCEELVCRHTLGLVQSAESTGSMSENSKLIKDIWSFNHWDHAALRWLHFGAFSFTAVSWHSI